MNGELVLNDPETDTLLAEFGPWPAASPAEVNEQVTARTSRKGWSSTPGGRRAARVGGRARFGATGPSCACPLCAAPRQGLRGLSASQNTKRDAMVRARIRDDRTVVEISRDVSERTLAPRVDRARIDATTEAEIAAQIAEDEAEAMRDAAVYARRVRRKVGLSQAAFAKRIGVPVDTVRNWEQGKRAPRGLARALLRIIDRAPEAALQALDRI